MTLPALISSCQCGKVRCKGRGKPILSAVCYCDDCQAGAAQIAALPGAAAVTLPDGGTHFLTWRDDRFQCVQGADLLHGVQLSDASLTRRMVASCCNTAMFLKFTRGHWTSSYAARFTGEIPPIEMRTQTRFRTSPEPIAGDAPVYRGFGLKLFRRLIAARLAMLVVR